MSILVADDDTVSRRVLERALSRAGYEVRAVGDGREACDILTGEAPPRLAILDWEMPGLTGIEVCRTVRAQALAVPIYLIVLTSKGQTEDVLTAFKAGADDYITKPFEVGELRARVSVGTRLVMLQQGLADRVTELEQALAHVKQLEGLIPICAWCRQVRNDKNYWVGVEDYLSVRSGLQFSHAICPPCRTKVSASFRAPPER
jgi:DNA-binding response OmpR family regulator